jgi:hypothetical protein
MFRKGGKVSSYGNGIASGLTSKPKRGLVDEPGGYAGISMSGLKNYADIFGGSGSGGTSGGQITSRARSSVSSRNPFKISGYTPRQFAPSSFREELRALSFPGLKTTGLMSLPFAAVGGLAYLNRPKNLEALQIMKDEPASTFDETNIDDFDDYTKRLVEAEKGDSEKISFTDALFMDPKTKTYPKIFGRTEDRDKLREIEKEKQRVDDAIVEDFEVSGEAAKVEPGKTAVDAIFSGGEKRATARKQTENILSDDTILNKQNTANEELTLEEVKDALGYKKAFRRDLGDTFGRAAAAFIGAPSLSEGAQKFFEAESRTGPGRAEKIETAAATFMLKDKAQTKRDKANVEMMKAKIDYQIDAGSNISLPKSLLAANKSGLLNNKELAVGIQGATSPTTGKNYKFKGVVTKDEFAGKLADAEVGDTFVVTAKVKGGDGIEKIVKRIVEVQLDDQGRKTPVGIYNI